MVRANTNANANGAQSKSRIGNRKGSTDSQALSVVELARKWRQSNFASVSSVAVQDLSSLECELINAGDDRQEVEEEDASSGPATSFSG